MAANPFDQFDEAPAAEQATANPFDQFDEAPVEPVVEQPVPAAEPESTEPAPNKFSPVRAGVGALETAAQFATGAIAEPLAGLAGLAGLPFGSEQGAENVKSVREALTYQPRTPAGQATSRGAGAVLAPIGKAIESASEATGDAGYAVGGPVAGAVAYAVPSAILEAVGIKGTKQAKRAAVEAAVQEGGAALLTQEARKTLVDSGLYTPEQLRTIAAGDVEQLDRLARFQRLGIQPTRGDIQQTMQTQKPEAQLIQSAQDESGAALRAVRKGQTQALAKNVEEMIDQTGVPAEIGNSIKDALEGRKTILKSRAKQAYEALGQQTEALDVPILIQNYKNIEGMPDAGGMRDIATQFPAQARALEDLMAEFGISDNPKAIERLANLDDPVVPQQVSIANFERLRQRLKGIEKADQSGNLSRVIGPIRAELDRQVDIASSVLERSGNPNVAALAKEARHNYRALKEEFDPKALTEQLVADRKGSSIPQLEASQVYSKLVAPSTPIEQFDRVVQSLKGEGAKGRRALADLQASMAMDLLDSSFKGVTTKMDGQAMISGPAMSKRFDKIKDKARLAFQDNPAALAKLEDVVRAAEDITPQNAAVPKGSAGFIMDALETIGLTTMLNRLPFGGAAVEGIRALSVRSGNQKALKNALKADPKLQQTADIMATDYPSLATALGLGYLVNQEQGEDEPNQNQ